ncbi:nucleotidyltransferase domain-containing protein [Pedobacter cryophilus]|uniref:Nucleotidyltransferase n=1 Tax=Pedobacter cryophilus TaxID=2571271 RepID=A0A4U1C212_9SPHI|nr:nucleotidyltransferase [Pedobacter cryophilus]TKB99145.1 nucleotidyltransferase [Pedobacter cryophilus]
MQDIFLNYELQREELLARIAENLQLDDTRKSRMEQAYKAISELIDLDQGFFRDMDIDVYPQGSVLTGTTVKPYLGSEFDLDIVLQINELYSKFTPAEIYQALLKKLENDGRYRDKIEKKNRCIRIKYADDFHMDILPGCIIVYGETTLKIPDRLLEDWATSDPKGFADWFLMRANATNSQPVLESYYKNLFVELKAEVQELPNDSYYLKKPLQRAVQLVKRYRDIFFAKDDTYCTSSIVITTLMGLNYQGENSIYETIDNAINRIRSLYTEAIGKGRKFTIQNPALTSEYFTDSWTDAHYDHFYRFIEDFHGKWIQLKSSFEQSGKAYVELFDEGIYKKSLQDQITVLSKFSESKITQANSLILTGIVHTSKTGQIQKNNGYDNKPHHNHGDH